MSDSFPSVAAMVWSRIEETPEADAYYYPDEQDSWQTLKWREVGQRLELIGAGLLALGLGPEDRVGILATTRVEWILADLAIVCAGGATTTIYPSNTAEECAYIIKDSQTRFVFVEDKAQADKIREVREQLPELQRVILLEGGGGDELTMSLRELESMGEQWLKDSPGAVREASEAITPDRLATLIYTSGTTGQPKGVELLHDCWVYEGEALAELKEFMRPDDRQYLWLPMSHSFGKVLEISSIRIGVPTAIDGRIPKLVENLAVVQPTFMAAAPRIFEKVYNKIVTGAQSAGGLKLRIFRWAMEVGRKVSQQRQSGKEPRGLLWLQLQLADELVFSKIRATFGGRIRYFISGSAPLSQDIAEFFHAAGLLILEGYGLTESSAASVCNRPDGFRFGYVGQAFPGTEIKIDRSEDPQREDGEILLRSRGIMRGYRNLPEVNAETLTEDGWLRTGDIGILEDGFLKITDRKKNLIKTAGGKYVAPQALESQLKALCPYLSQVLVHGDRRNFCSALICLDPEAILGWAKEQELEELSYAELSAHPAAVEMVQRAITAMNATLPSFSTVKKFALLPRDLSVEDGELTPSLKVKRKVVESNYSDILEDFYKGTLAAL